MPSAATSAKASQFFIHVAVIRPDAKCSSLVCFQNISDHGATPVFPIQSSASTLSVL